MIVLFQLNNKRSRKYEKAERIKNVHQVVFHDTWLVDAVALLTATLAMIIINVADPSSNFANMNFVMRVLFLIGSVAFVHNLFKFIFRPNATYRKICDSISFPVLVNSITSGRSMDETKDYPDVHINYSIIDENDEQMAVLIQNATDLVLLDYINAPEKASRMVMTIEAFEIENACEKIGIDKGSDVRFLIARIKSNALYAPMDTVSPKQIDDSVLVYDKISPVVHLRVEE